MPRKKSEKPKEKQTCPYCHDIVDQLNSIKVGEDRWHYPCGDSALAEWKKQQPFVNAVAEYFDSVQSLFSSQEELAQMEKRVYIEMERMNGGDE